MKSKLSVLAVSIVSAGQALAQTERPANDVTLEEVVVTAEHREASLQKTEISLTAMTADTLRDTGISNANDLAQYIPNVTVAPLSGSSMGYGLNIRGVGQNETIVTFDPAAGMYINDVLIPKSPGALTDVLDMERIEVLRGPQGTLYGRNTIAGAINYITKKPTDKWEGNLRVTLGTKNQRDIKGMLNVPLLSADSALGELNFRVTAGLLKRDGFITNTFPNAATPDLDNQNRKVGEAQLQWKPTSALTAQYTYDRTRIDENPQPQMVTTIRPGSFAGGLEAPYSVSQDHRPTSVQSNKPMQAQAKVDGHALNVAYDISDSMQFRSITGYRENWSGGVNDLNDPISVINTATDQSEISFTQEFRLTGTMLDDRLSYSTGTFYMDEHGEIENDLLIFGAPNTLTHGRFENKNWAVYGQGTYKFSDQWNLTAGARYTHENRKMSKDEWQTPPPPPPQPIHHVDFPDANRSFSDFSPMASLGYNWNEDINSYVKISKGYQAGGFNVRDAVPAAFVKGFDAEKLVAYELGTKAMTFNKRFRANTAFWFSDYTNKRVNTFDPTTLSNIIRNAGTVQIYGLELELLGNLTENLQAGLDYGYTKGKYIKYDDGKGGDLSSSSGFPFTPKNTVHAFLGYSLPLSIGKLSGRLDYSYRDSIQFLTGLPELNSGRSISLWNARVSLDDIQGQGDTKFRVSAWAKNLTNLSYWNQGANIYSTFGFNINTYGDPRTVGVDLEFMF